MASVDIHIHPAANMVWGKVSELAGSAIRISTNETSADPSGNGQPAGPSEPMALAMSDPDGETHIYVFTELGKQNLIRELTSGVIVP